jgi:putative hydrolase of HD superfamily
MVQPAGSAAQRCEVIDLLPICCCCCAAQEVDVLWHEYEQQCSPEAHLLKDFDKLEMIIQAHQYEQGQGLDLQQFFDSTRGKFKTDTG